MIRFYARPSTCLLQTVDNQNAIDIAIITLSVCVVAGMSWWGCRYIRRKVWHYCYAEWCLFGRAMLSVCSSACQPSRIVAGRLFKPAGFH